MTYEGQLGGDKKVVGRVVHIAFAAQKDLLASLDNHAKDGGIDAIKGRPWRRSAIEEQTFERLNASIFAHGACDTLDQLVSAGLRPVCLTLPVYLGRLVCPTFHLL